jgi:hypothetical protein
MVDTKRPIPEFDFSDDEFEVILPNDAPGVFPGLFINVYGSSGVGKTTFAGSVARATEGNALMLDMEQRGDHAGIARLFLPLADIEKVDPKKRVKALNDWISGLMDKIASREGKFGKVEALVIDSVDRYFEDIQALFMASRGIEAMQIQLYEQLYKSANRIFWHAYNELRSRGISVINLCRIIETKAIAQDGTEYTTWKPALSPKFSDKFAHMSDVNVYIVPAKPGEDYNRFVTYNKGGQYVHAKDYTNRLPGELHTTWDAIRAPWFGLDPEQYPPSGIARVESAKTRKKVK